MTLTLTVDGDRWRAHLRTVAEQTPGLVPVAKGNGYGFGLGRLARKAAWLGADLLAVGTYEELPEVAQRFAGDLLVLTPWRPFTPDLDPALHKRVIHTVSRLTDLAALREHQPDARVVLERMTSMRRHGMTAADLWQAADAGRTEGVAIHLPMTGGNLAEARRLMDDVVGAGARTVFVSHLTVEELTRLRREYADLTIRPRVGTGLWLGDRGALRVGATVLDVHPLQRGDRYGYRGRSARSAGHLLVVTGGTAHGIGLAAPAGATSLRARATTAARGGLESMGIVRSPYFLDGRQLQFAEPPHMQASQLLLPQDARVPEVGDRVDVRVRYTTTAFDRVEIS